MRNETPFRGQAGKKSNGSCGSFVGGRPRAPHLTACAGKQVSTVVSKSWPVSQVLSNRAFAWHSMYARQFSGFPNRLEFRWPWQIWNDKIVNWRNEISPSRDYRVVLCDIIVGTWSTVDGVRCPALTRHQVERLIRRAASVDSRIITTLDEGPTVLSVGNSGAGWKTVADLLRNLFKIRFEKKIFFWNCD